MVMTLESPTAVLNRELVEAPVFDRGDDGALVVSALMVPWMSPTQVVGWDTQGRAFGYREQFAPGAFRKYADPAVAQRVRLVWGHSNDFPNQLGRCQVVSEEQDGARGVFRVPRSIADRAREELAGAAVSVSFRSITPRPFTETPSALVTREEVALIHLGVVDAPAYSGARVLELRADHDEALAILEAEQEQEAERARRVEVMCRSIEAARDWRDLTDAEKAYLDSHRPSA